MTNTARAIRYAAIDAGNISGAVYGLGLTPEAAIADALSQNEGTYTSVPCTISAYQYVVDHGGAPSPELTVTRDSVCLRSEEG